MSKAIEQILALKVIEDHATDPRLAEFERDLWATLVGDITRLPEPQQMQVLAQFGDRLMGTQEHPLRDRMALEVLIANNTSDLP